MPQADTIFLKLNTKAANNMNGRKNESSSMIFERAWDEKKKKQKTVDQKFECMSGDHVPDEGEVPEGSGQTRRKIRSG